MQNFNYHTHTYRCKHADFSITDEEYVELLIRHGFKKMAFTDHCPQKQMIDKRTYMRMDYDARFEYYESIKALKEKYKNDIDIELGFEIEYLPGLEEDLMELKKETDKLVLGQHFIYDENNEKLKIFRYTDFSYDDLMRYASYIETAMEKGLADIIVHPDLFMIARDSFSDGAEETTRKICLAAEKYQIPLEINLTEIVLYLTKKKSRISYPDKVFWKIASEYDIKVIYGIDAHFRDQIELYEESVDFVNDYLGKDTIQKLKFCDENL